MKIFPRKWHVVEVMPDGRISIYSSHRTRAAAVLAIPVNGVGYSVMLPERIRLMNALAASLAATSTQEPR